MIRHQLKHGVCLAGLQPQMVLAYQVACSIYADKGYGCVMTSAVDGSHKRYSLHYKGFAVDLRSKNLFMDAEEREAKLKQMVIDIQLALTGLYQVFLENYGTPNEHIHIEYDPKLIEV